MGGWISIRPSARVIYQYKTSIVRGLAPYRVGPSLIRGTICPRGRSNAQETETALLSQSVVT